MVCTFTWLAVPALILTAACATRAANVNAATAPHGNYVEARTATVFAGACHYASEREMLGREAVMAWRVESGAFDGVDLTGVEALAVVAADANLEHDNARRTSVVLVNDNASEAQRLAMASWVRARHAAVLGTVVAVKASPLNFKVDGDKFTVKAGNSIELAGAALANRRCCNMPQEIWYEPLSPMTKRLVGSVETFRQADPSLRRDFTYPADNCAFVGTF